MIPIDWFVGLAIKDENDPFITAFRNGQITPGDVETTVLGGGVYVINEVPLPDGLWDRDGRFYFDCNNCGNETEWEAEPEDFVFGQRENVCGGSPRCLP